MKSRMDRYQNIDHKEYNRLDKNKDLYENVGNNTKYTNFTDVGQSNAYLLDTTKESYQTREDYQHLKDFKTKNLTPKVKDITPKVKKELDEFNYLYQDHENRVYDINSVLKTAKENRKEKDALEEKRNLKNTNYNILASLNKEELEKYRNEKKSKNKPDEEGLRELIDTITSKTLAGEISKETSVNLLSDLMATSAHDKIGKEDKLELSKEILDKESLKKLNEAKKDINLKQSTSDDIMKDIDKSFYTKSMDLSDKDFFSDDEEEDMGPRVPTFIKVLLVLIILALIGVCVYFVYKSH